MSASCCKATQRIAQPRRQTGKIVQRHAPIARRLREQVAFFFRRRTQWILVWIDKLADDSRCAAFCGPLLSHHVQDEIRAVWMKRVKQRAYNERMLLHCHVEQLPKRSD